MEKHKYANTRTDDLWNAVEAAGAKGLTAIAHDFTSQPGIPLLRVGGLTCAGGNTKVELTQGEFSRDRKDAIEAEGRRWKVPVLARAGTGAVARQVIAGGAGTLTLPRVDQHRSEEHTSELQSLMRISYAVFCLKKKK